MGRGHFGRSGRRRARPGRDESQSQDGDLLDRGRHARQPRTAQDQRARQRSASLPPGATRVVHQTSRSPRALPAGAHPATLPDPRRAVPVADRRHHRAHPAGAQSLAYPRTRHRQDDRRPAPRERPRHR